GKSCFSLAFRLQVMFNSRQGCAQRMHFPLDGRTPKSWLRGSPKGLPASGGDGVQGRAPGQTKSDKIADRNKGEKVTKSLTLDSLQRKIPVIFD
ncbi:MAG: hypothetical protein SOY75_02275, partial [Peptoniphilaceae bacterium]|nr:hypothetical protein [Peptoniphilaceae bacterium]